MEQQTRPLFQFDPGWLFIVAGLVVCAAGLILPAQSDLHSLRVQLDHLRSEEMHAYARLKAHSDFMDQVDRADPGLIRRLAATQLNLMPEGETPILLAASAPSPVTHWIETAVKVDIRPPKTTPVSMLSRLANGPHRLWMFAAGAVSVFIGMLLAPISLRSVRRVDFVASGATDEDDRSFGESVPAECMQADAETAIVSEPAGVAMSSNESEGDERNFTAESSIDDDAGHIEYDDPETTELSTIAALDNAPGLPGDVLSDEEVASVLEGVASDLRELERELAARVESAHDEAEQAGEVLDALESESVTDHEDDDDLPEIETDANHLLNPHNRMHSGNESEEL